MPSLTLVIIAMLDALPQMDSLHGVGASFVVGIIKCDRFYSVFSADVLQQ